MWRLNLTCFTATLLIACGGSSDDNTDAAPADTDASPVSDGMPGDSNGDEQILIEDFAPPGGGLVWTCPDGTELALDSEMSKQSTICLGIDGSECPRTPPRNAPGPGEAQCDDPAYNRFKDTCVEQYFSCFQPSGTCTIEANSNQTWSNGAVQDRNYMGFVAAYFQDPNGQPCITAEISNGVVVYRK